MSSVSIGALEHAREQMERSFVTHPDFQVRFVCGFQTGFKGPGTSAAELCFYPEAPNLTWNLTWDHVGRWIQMPRLLVSWAGSAYARRGPDRDKKDRPIHSKFLRAIFISENGSVPGRMFKEEVDSLDQWIYQHWNRLPIFSGQTSIRCPWIDLVCLMRLVDPSFTFSLGWRADHDHRTGKDIEIFKSIDEYWRVFSLQSDEPPGYYLMWPSKDARFVSIKVIERLIEIAKRATGEPAPVAGLPSAYEATGLPTTLTSETPVKDQKKPELTRGSKAIAAAYELKREGQPVTLKAACERHACVERT